MSIKKQQQNDIETVISMAKSMLKSVKIKGSTKELATNELKPSLNFKCVACQ